MATVGKKMGGVPALGWWLMAVGTVRLVLAFSGYLDTASLGVATYANAEMTGVHGRTLGVWMLLSCTLCFLCAFNLDCKPIYWATFLSFLYGYVHFILEYLLYHTSSSQLWYGCCSSGTLTVMPVLPSNTDESLLSG
ncbi:hypothetical protein PR202_ga12967 [Eleusine coracana subsp. coracana]|uniref:Ergosterol biosynthetic protein 28 n=1 Tax=Eleusine coracana subsp. coracana TaxID=191504 RepID=A0AAV5CDB6_ELECO|nr:hypothetical protein PR202_ga12963 [Eleusine coracana subsp. coracana]GJM96154.1 hypothetical protein PR202_ga12967 [Eleusine coracana subsp. coracana]